MATIDRNSSIVSDDTSRHIIESAISVMGLFKRIGIVFICTATSAIDVATVRIVSTLLTDRVTVQFFCDTDFSTMDGHSGIIERMSILATAIDRALDLWFRSFGAMSLATCSYRNFGIINPCHLILDGSRSIDITSRSTEDHTVLISGSTNGTACDVNRSLTTRGAAFNDMSTFVIGIGSH